MDKQYKYCFKTKKLVEYSSHNEDCSESTKVFDKTHISEVQFSNDGGCFLTEGGAIYKESNDFFLNIPSDLLSLNITQENYKKMMDIFSKVIKQTTN